MVAFVAMLAILAAVITVAILRPPAMKRCKCECHTDCAAVCAKACETQCATQDGDQPATRCATYCAQREEDPCTEHASTDSADKATEEPKLTSPDPVNDVDPAQDETD